MEVRPAKAGLGLCGASARSEFPDFEGQTWLDRIQSRSAPRRLSRSAGAARWLEGVGHAGDTLSLKAQPLADPLASSPISHTPEGGCRTLHRYCADAQDRAGFRKAFGAFFARSRDRAHERCRSLLTKSTRGTKKSCACSVSKMARPNGRDLNSTRIRASGSNEEKMARPGRFELPTPRFVVWCSIQLSYGRAVAPT